MVVASQVARPTIRILKKLKDKLGENTYQFYEMDQQRKLNSELETSSKTVRIKIKRRRLE